VSCSSEAGTRATSNARGTHMYKYTTAGCQTNADSTSERTISWIFGFLLAATKFTTIFWGESGDYSFNTYLRSECLPLLTVRSVTKRRVGRTIAAKMPKSARIQFVVLFVSCSMGVASVARAQVISIEARAIQPGEVVRVEVPGPADLNAVTASAFGKKIPLEYDAQRQVWNALIGIDLATKPDLYRITIGSQARFLRVTSRPAVVRHLKVAPNFVNPPASEMERIAEEVKKQEQIFARSTPRQWIGPFILPVNEAPTSSFGTVSFYNGERRSPHAGVDFPSPAGTPIHAANHGTVVLAEPLYFTGNTVIVDYGDGLYSLFAHLSEFRSKVGDVVGSDSVIGLVGATGRVTGPHLHWTVRLHGARVDATSLVYATTH
jgi:murein DD-endopeptidase MepM/ murein hydrolase activator NlpD